MAEPGLVTICKRAAFSNGSVRTLPASTRPPDDLCINLILVNVTGFVILGYFRYHPNLRFQPMSSAELRAIAPIYVAVNSLYAVAIGAAWFFPWLSYGIYFFVLLWVTIRSIRRVSPAIQDDESP